ncbi:MAG: hypothetical protein JRC93_12770 [Deltaproteobacteria bacterium]|nr:hypothetical protein [Deltaproteobacteria bacterium]
MTQVSRTEPEPEPDTSDERPMQELVDGVTLAVEFNDVCHAYILGSRKAYDWLAKVYTEARRTGLAGEPPDSVGDPIHSRRAAAYLHAPKFGKQFIDAFHAHDLETALDLMEYDYDAIRVYLGQSEHEDLEASQFLADTYALFIQSGRTPKYEYIRDDEKVRAWPWEEQD